MEVGEGLAVLFDIWLFLIKAQYFMIVVSYALALMVQYINLVFYIYFNTFILVWAYMSRCPVT